MTSRPLPIVFSFLLLASFWACETITPLALALLKDVAPVAVDAVGSAIKDRLAQKGGGCVGLEGIEDDDGYVFAVCEPGADVELAAPLLVAQLDGPLDTGPEGSICYELSDMHGYVLCKARAVHE